MINNKIVTELIKGRIDYINEMYSKFIQDSSYRFQNHPMDFKNFIIGDLEKNLKKVELK